MRMKLSTVLDVPAERAWAEVQTSRLLEYVAWPLQAFEPLDPPALPTVWVEGQYLVRLRVFGLFAIGTQWIVITTPSRGPSKFQMRDNGRGSLVSRWDHLITIEPVSATRCRYTDELEVRAGFSTPLVWAFAQVFYRHRQRRWRGLVASAFAPLNKGKPA